MSHGDSDVSSQGNKKYLLIRTETGTFVVPVDSAVGCIVSEQEIAKMLHPQSVLPSSLHAREFSKDALLAACSQLKPIHHSDDNVSPSNGLSPPVAKKTSASPKADKTLASASRRNVNIGQRKHDIRLSSSPPPQKTPALGSRMKEKVRRKKPDIHDNSSPALQSKTRVKNSISKCNSRRKSLSNRLVQNARQRFAMKRELCSLGLLEASPRKKKS